MDKIQENIVQIHKLVMEIDKESPVLGQILLEGFGLSFNIINSIIENNGRPRYDVTEHIQIINKIMGFDLEVLVQHILEKKAAEGVGTSKPVDEETLGFITSNSELDDYERFIAESSAKKDLEFLRKEL